jgi:hypothetical protein
MILARSYLECLPILVAVNVARHQFAGAHYGIVAALIFCQVNSADYSFINGKKVVDQEQLTTIELPILVEQHNQIAHQLLEPT